MKDIKNVCEFSDLLAYAESIGIPWNKAHDILVKNEIPPMYESNMNYFELSEVEEEEDDSYYSYDTQKILVGFMKEEKVDFINLIEG